MGSYIEIEGDLIRLAKLGKFDIIGHGCNCFATMGAGIALPIGKTFPEAKKADEIYKAKPINRLGNFTVGHNTKYDLVIVNFYTQFTPGPDLKIWALRNSFRNFVEALRETLAEEDGESFEGLRLGLPLIGCGIAGGDWKEVSKIVKEEFKDFEVTIVKFNPNA